MKKEKRYCKHCKDEIIQNTYYKDNVVWWHNKTNNQNCEYKTEEPFSLTTTVAELYVDPKDLKVFSNEDLLKLFN